LDSSSQEEEEEGEEGGEHQSIDYQLLLTEHCVICLVGRRSQGETMRRKKRETEADRRFY